MRQPFEGITLPSQWKRSSFKLLCKLNYGKSSQNVSAISGPYSIYGTGGKIGESNDCLYNGETIVIGRKGTLKNPIYVNEPIWVIDTAFYLSDFNQVNVRWLYYFLNSFDIAGYNESTGVPSLSRETLERIDILYCPPPDQQKIAEILTTVDNAIEKTETLIEKYKNIKQGLMQDLLTKGIDEHGNIRSEETHEFKDSPIGRIPKEWEIVSFTRAIDYIEGGGTPSRFKEEYYLGNIPWATVKDFDGKLYKEDTLEHISLEALKKSSTRLIVEKRLIIATRMGLGRAFINIVPMAINQDVKAITINENFRIEFVLYWYLSIADVVERMGVGSTVKGISLKDLKNIIMVKPSIQEQDLIVNKIKQINVVIENEQKYFESLQQLKQGLMKDLLTGKVRVPLEEATG